MRLRIFPDKQALSAAAAEHAAAVLRREIDAKRYTRIVAATGTSQLIFLDRLTAAKGIDWTRVDLFHLDEYIGLPADHPASFRRYMRENLIDKVGIVSFHLLDVDDDAVEVVERVGGELKERPVDVAFVGIGENAHLAFNDPPADFAATAAYLVVDLDTACRRQQVGEGWFPDLDAVPRRAVSMSIRQILASNEILVIVPDERKALAVRATLEGPITPQVPASILRSHHNVTIYLDEPSASLLSPGTRERNGE